MALLPSGDCIIASAQMRHFPAFLFPLRSFPAVQPRLQRWRRCAAQPRVARPFVGQPWVSQYEPHEPWKGAWAAVDSGSVY